MLRLRQAGIIEDRLARAFEAVPRQNFVPVQYLDDSYSQSAFPIECGQTMPSPDMIARCLHVLETGPNMRVLEIGTGSGYQTALLGKLVSRVTSLERYRTLADKARSRLEALKIVNCLISHADGINGASGALFDRIIINGALETPPKHLIDQLASNGILLAPVGPPDGVQTYLKMKKIGLRFDTEKLFEVRMQPLRAGLAQAI